jgi:hypothetical protein
MIMRIQISFTNSLVIKYIMGSTLHMDAYEVGSDDDYIYEDIFNEEEDAREEFQDKQYYIGLPFYDKVFDELILASSIRPSTFMHYPAAETTHYLKQYSVVRTQAENPEIMQLYIHPATEAYNVVLKTHWIRLIQRTWKNVMVRRTETIRKWIRPDTMKRRELQRGLPEALPGLRGMLYHLRVSPRGI